MLSFYLSYSRGVQRRYSGKWIASVFTRALWSISCSMMIVSLGDLPPGHNYHWRSWLRHSCSTKCYPICLMTQDFRSHSSRSQSRGRRSDFPKHPPSKQSREAIAKKKARKSSPHSREFQKHASLSPSLTDPPLFPMERS